MTITYPVTILNSRLTVVANAIDAGPSAGILRLLSAASTTLGTVTLADPSSTVAAGVLTLNGLPKVGSISVNGVLALADLEDSNANVVAFGLTIGNSSAFDIVVSNTTVHAGDLVTLNSATITGR